MSSAGEQRDSRVKWNLVATWVLVAVVSTGLTYALTAEQPTQPVPVPVLRDYNDSVSCEHTGSSSTETFVFIISYLSAERASNIACRQMISFNETGVMMNFTMFFVELPQSETGVLYSFGYWPASDEFVHTSGSAKVTDIEWVR